MAVTSPHLQRVYAIFFQGRYLRAVGPRFRGGEFEWVDDAAEARLYGTPENLNKHLLQVARACPDGGPWPGIVQFTVGECNVIDCTERFNKARARANKAQATRDANLRSTYQAHADAEVSRLRAELSFAETRARRCKPADA